MAKFHDRWAVLPHGPVQAIDDGILSVEGEIRMPFGRFPRRMTVGAEEYVGHLATVSAYLELPVPDRERVLGLVLAALPDRVDLAADLTLHLARRRTP